MARRNGPTFTFDGAAKRRAVHSLYEQPCVFDDSWAIKLLDAATRRELKDGAFNARRLAAPPEPSSALFASALGNFRTTEELVEREVSRGVGQYVILGAGLDSFGYRRRDLADRLSVYELDHPAPQAIKRSRAVRALRGAKNWPANVELVPIDFEVTTIDEALAASSFDATRPSVVSWLNSIPYVSKEGVEASFAGLATIMTAGSKVAFNYACNVPLSPEARAALAAVAANVVSRGEPWRSRYEPGEIEEVGDQL